MSRFLPPILKNHSCCIDNHDLRLSTESDGSTEKLNLRQLYIYTVTWHDLKQSKQSDSVDNAELATASPQFSFMSVSPKKDMSPEDMQICKRIAPCNVPRSRIRECQCDGPCGKIKVNFDDYLHFAKTLKRAAANEGGKFPVSEMRIIGLCDHYICQDCLENAPVIETTGVFICPNKRCCQIDLARLYTSNRRPRRKIQEIITMPLRRMASTSAVYKDGQGIVPNVLDNMPCINLVDVRLTTFTSLRNSDKIYRQQQIIEIYGDSTLLQTLNVLKEYERLSSLDIVNRVYYCPSGLINERSSWKHIRKDDLSMPITKFGQEDQHIDIIFDCTSS